MVNTPAAQKVSHIDQVVGFQWKILESSLRGQPRRVDAELWHDNELCHTCFFTEGLRENEDHWLENDYLGSPFRGDASQKTFEEFMLVQKNRIVKQVEAARQAKCLHEK